MRTQTYNFREFMQGSHEIKVKEVLTYSSLMPLSFPYVMKEMFINEGVLLVGTVGLLAIGLAYMENRLAKRGDSVNADKVALVGSIVMRVIGYGSVLVFLGHLFTKFPI